MTTQKVPTLIAFRPNEDDKELIVKLMKQYRAKKKRDPKMSFLIRRGLELLEKEGV